MTINKRFNGTACLQVYPIGRYSNTRRRTTSYFFLLELTRDKYLDCDKPYKTRKAAIKAAKRLAKRLNIKLQYEK